MKPKKQNKKSQLQGLMFFCRPPRFTFYVSRFSFRIGFTLIELLVVLGIVAMISSLTIVWSSANRNQLALSSEEAVVGELMLRSKSLAITTKRTNLNIPCGYGVRLDYTANSYVIFSYELPSSSSLRCGDVIANAFVLNTGDPGYKEVAGSAGKLPPNVTFGSGSSRLDTVFFLAPNPDTFIATGGGSFSNSGTGNIYLATQDGGATKTITVAAPLGQVNF